jgi:hypothetical protein
MIMQGSALRLDRSFFKDTVLWGFIWGAASDIFSEICMGKKN